MKSHTENETSEVFCVGLADIASHYNNPLCGWTHAITDTALDAGLYGTF